tara:strand:- start:945 stop:1424 length:480 start_codon:yes stop_codon:yes gene_type:complete
MEITNNKIKLFLITLIIDIIIIYLLFKENFNCFDYYLLLFVLLNHILFIISLIIDYDYLIIYSHVSIYLVLLLSLFVTNKKLIILFILFCVFIKILWNTSNQCLILALKKRKKIPKNYIGKYVNFLVTSVLIILILKYFYEDIIKIYLKIKNKIKDYLV